MSKDEHILLVDDTPESVASLEARLRSLGYRTTTLSDGVQALESMDVVQPDLIVLDVMMPELNGYQTCRKIRKTDRAVPIVILTAKTDPADEFWARECGANVFLTKPIEPNVVVEHIRALLDDEVTVVGGR